VITTQKAEHPYSSGLEIIPHQINKINDSSLCVGTSLVYSPEKNRDKFISVLDGRVDVKATSAGKHKKMKFSVIPSDKGSKI